MKKLTLLLLLLPLLLGCEKELNAYEKLGYTENQIKVIEKLNDPSKVLELEYNTYIIELIQSNNFKEENLKTYLEIKEKYDYDTDTIIEIGNDYDPNIEYNENVLSFIKAKYFIKDNLERYLTYQENHNDLELDEIIRRVNSNIDYDFYTNDNPTDLSKGYLILVNKFNYVDKDYVPENMVKIDPKYGVSYELESTVYEAYKKMWNDAYQEGLVLYINSPYRSYNTQYTLYHNYAAKDGYSLADTYSARPGYSEHQTGLAFDVTSKTTNFSSFEYSNEYKWLIENAHKYGFILRYPEDKEYITGYQFESWHYRYVGEEVATKIKEEDLTYEEYYAYYVK